MRDLKKEAAWAKKVYKQYYFRCRIDNGDYTRMEKILNSKSFSDWVREKLLEDEHKSNEGD